MTTKTEQFKIRTTKKELKFIADAAKLAGTNKTDFIITAAKNAAKNLGMDIQSYFVSDTKYSPQNTRASFFSHEVDQKIDHGVGKGASPVRGSDCAINGGSHLLSKGRSAPKKRSV